MTKYTIQNISGFFRTTTLTNYAGYFAKVDSFFRETTF